MEIKTQSYVGPRAIFDPLYIPPKILFRENEKTDLFSILRDSFSDGFYLNMLYQGVQGIGKKVIINKTIQELCDARTFDADIASICFDCREKNLEELITQMIIELNQIAGTEIDYNIMINSRVSELWNLLKIISKKLEFEVVLLFNNIEYLKPEIFRKFLQYGKEFKLNLISTVNNTNRSSTLELINEFDLKKKLRYYSHRELYEILLHRISLTFLNHVDKEIIELISDFIFEHHIPVPGKGMDILRHLYPILVEPKKYENLEILEAIQNQFESVQNVDHYYLLSFLSEEDLLTILFLDNISNYFLTNNKYYISFIELRDLYGISCESIEYEISTSELHDLLCKLQDIGLISVSRKPNQPNFNSKYKNGKESDTYFININPNHLKAMVDAYFSEK